MTNGVLDSNQKIVSDGIVFHYDIAQLRSYPTSGTTITDLSGNSNTGTLVNGVAFSSNNGGSLVFDGINDYISITNPTTIASQNLTLSFWIYPLPATNVVTTLFDFDHAEPSFLQGWVLQSEDATTNRYYYLAYYSSTSFQPAGLFGIGKGVQITNNVWQNLTYVKNGLNVIGYINGSQVYSATASNSTITYISNKNARIGTSVLAVPGNRFTKSNIAQTLIYNRALTATEVLQNFNANRSRYGL